MIKDVFNQKKSLFIPFVMAGYPDNETSIKAIMVLTEIGSDIIEIGVPFSDPIADGPINQKAAEVAIENGMNLSKVLELVQTVRDLGCTKPIILFSYLNPILAFGYKEFCIQAKAVGVEGVLIVDLPPEEGEVFYSMAKKEGLEIVLLVSPTTDTSRLFLYEMLEPSFIYYISRLAVTGMQQDISSSLEAELDELRNQLPNVKIAVGFGISLPDQTKYVSTIADGVIVGSKLVSTLGIEGIEQFRVLAEQFFHAVQRDKI